MTHPTVSFPPSPVATITSAHLLDTVTENVDHYEFRLVPAGEVLEAAEGSIVLVKDGSNIRRLVFMEDEVVPGPLIYYPLAQMDFLNWARREASHATLADVILTIFAFAAGGGSIAVNWHPSGAPLVLKVHLVLCVLVTLTALGDLIRVRRRLKKDAVQFIKASKEATERKIELPSGFQLAAA